MQFLHIGEEAVLCKMSSIRLKSMFFHGAVAFDLIILIMYIDYFVFFYSPLCHLINVYRYIATSGGGKSEEHWAIKWLQKLFLGGFNACCTLHSALTIGSKKVKFYYPKTILFWGKKIFFALHYINILKKIQET